jgi:glycosyltransferase involved in cell wall biosynthesis
MNVLPISVCMIAGAEAGRIRRALDSVAGWTAEIVVVLNEEVNDGTDHIAEAAGARVFREPWKGYIGQKNSAAARATQPWLLGLDADEEVSDALRQEILATLGSPAAAAPYAAFSFPRCSRFCGRWIRHGDWYPDRTVRLWRRGCARWAGQEPHARLEVQGRVGRLRGDLWHYTAVDLAHQATKSLAYADYFVRQRQAGPGRVGWYDLWLRPGWRFLRGYVLRRGFLDGWQGLAIARLAAFETFLKYARLREAGELAHRRP